MSKDRTSLNRHQGAGSSGACALHVLYRRSNTITFVNGSPLSFVPCTVILSSLPSFGLRVLRC